MKAPLILFVCFLALVPFARSQETCPCRDLNPCDVWDSAKLVVKANVTDVVEDPDNARVIFTLLIITNYRGSTGGSFLNSTTNETAPAVTSGSTIKIFGPPLDHACAVQLELDHIYLITAATDRQGNLFTSKCLMIVSCDHQVCGSDGKTYNSECDLRKEICTNPSANLYKRGDHACLATCDVRRCGSRPLIPERLCSDGVTLSGVGNCVNSDSGCVWDIVACPCEHGLNVFPDGYTTISNTDPCIVEVCDNGQLLSSPINCPQPMCNAPLVLPGTCCPICPEDQTQPPGQRLPQSAGSPPATGQQGPPPPPPPPPPGTPPTGSGQGQGQGFSGLGTNPPNPNPPTTPTGQGSPPQTPAGQFGTQ